MIMQVKHPETNEVITIDVKNMGIEDLQDLYKTTASEKSLMSAIGNLNIPAEAKALLMRIKDFSIQVGTVALEIGRKILELIILFVKKYPSTAIGLIVGSVIGMLLSSIPILGWALGWVLMPLCTALGLGIGFWKDMSNDSTKQAIQKSIDELFSSLKDIPAPSKV